MRRGGLVYCKKCTSRQKVAEEWGKCGRGRDAAAIFVIEKKAKDAVIYTHYCTDEKKHWVRKGEGIEEEGM